MWHLDEDPGLGGAGDIKDSTANANHGTAESSMTSADQVIGRIGDGADFDGNDDSLPEYLGRDHCSLPFYRPSQGLRCNYNRLPETPLHLR